MTVTGVRRWVERTGPAAPALVSGIAALLLSVVLSLWLIERANPPRVQLGGVRELTLLSPTIPSRETDQRTLGLVVNSLGMMRIAGLPPREPVTLTAVSTALIAWLARPLHGSRRRLPWLSAGGISAAAAAGLTSPAPTATPRSAYR